MVVISSLDTPRLGVAALVDIAQAGAAEAAQRPGWRPGRLQRDPQLVRAGAHYSLQAPAAILD